jgi:hypothetical protein
MKSMKLQYTDKNSIYIYIILIIISKQLHSIQYNCCWYNREYINMVPGRRFLI